MILTAEVEIDMETLRLANSLRAHPLTRTRALEAIRDSVIDALDVEDRKRFEEYDRVNNPCYAEGGRMSIGRCYSCRRFSSHLREYSWTTGPGIGRFGNFCDKCWGKRPKNWEESMGFNDNYKPGAKFLRYIGKPQITASEHGQNAFGSILAEYDDGSRIGVICGHGGSAWLCLKCAQKIIDENPELLETK